MNPKFILPASLALTAHVFLLFGLPGKAPGSVLAAADEPKPPTASLLPVDTTEPVPATGDDPGSGSNRDLNPAPRPPDIPNPSPRPDDFTIPPLPPIPPGSRVDRIPADWGYQRAATGHTPRIYDPKDLDREPRARTQPAPSYPYDLRSQGVEGTVNVEFAVDEAGNTYDATIVGATVSGFADAALRAVARWKFEPGLKNGRHVRFRMSVPIMFRIDRL